MTNRPTTVRLPRAPRPSFGRINYAKPDDYLVLLPSLGDAGRIRHQAAQLAGGAPEENLAAIERWMADYLAHDPTLAYQWRDCDDVLDTAAYGGCADHAVLFGALARACGIPAVWVKTMDADWIREFRRAATCTSWRGHVFLEVFLAGRWRLLDAQAGRLWDDYDPCSRFLPCQRYAYDKGADPKALVLSLDWERWKRQTAAYFRRFDLSKLPLGLGRGLGEGPATAARVFIVGDNPVYQWAAHRCEVLGLRVELSFNTGFEVNLLKAQSNLLLVTCVGDRLVLPECYHAGYLPVGADELRRRIEDESGGVLYRRLDDGTRVALIYGKDLNAVRETINGFHF